MDGYLVLLTWEQIDFVTSKLIRIPFDDLHVRDTYDGSIFALTGHQSDLVDDCLEISNVKYLDPSEAQHEYGLSFDHIQQFSAVFYFSSVSY